MTQINLLRQVKNLNFPEGFLINGQIERSVKNLVANNSFETDLTGYADYGTMTKTRVTNETYTGVASCKVDVASGPHSGVQSTISTTAGKRYTISCYVKGANGNNFNLYVANATNDQIDATLNGSWQRVELTFIASGGGHAVFFRSGSIPSTFYLDAVQLEEGVTQATAFTTTQGNLTVAIKTLAGTDPSTTDPVYCRIDGVVRAITSALSLTLNAGVNTFNAGSTELATKEIDYFIYLGWNTTNSAVGLGVLRIPYCNTKADMSFTNTNEKGVLGANWDNVSTDKVVNIGRFNAILSAGPGFTWSIPATSVIINRPIFETRRLMFSPQLSATESMTVSEYSQITHYYQIVGDRIKVGLQSILSLGGTASYAVNYSTPFSFNPISVTDGGASGVVQISNGYIGNLLIYGSSNSSILARINNADNGGAYYLGNYWNRGFIEYNI